MLKIYIIGSNRYNGLKGELYNGMRDLEGISVLAVGFSEVYKFVLKKKDYKTLHDLEDKSIRESDIIVLVDNDEVFGKSYIGDDTLRELNYAKALGKTIWTSDMLFANYMKMMGQQ